MELKTKNGYNLYDVASALQKAIRRGDAKVAGYFALELWHSGFSEYLWKRLLTISAEDCWGIITKEIYALYGSYKVINEKKTERGRIFVSKAVILMSLAKKNRDADHLQNFVYDKRLVDEEELKKYIESVQKERISIPEYAYDCHTHKGKKMGKTKEDFFREEQKSLKPRQLGLFDDLV